MCPFDHSVISVLALIISQKIYALKPKKEIDNMPMSH